MVRLGHFQLKALRLALVLLVLLVPGGAAWAQVAPAASDSAARPASAAAAPAPADTRRPARRPEPPREAHRRLVGQYDSRYSVLNRRFCVLNGLKLGVEWPGRWRAGAAIYFLGTPVPTRAIRPAGIPAEAEAALRFRYLALYAERVLLHTRRWELSTPLQIGLGSNHVRYTRPDGSFDRTAKRFMAVVEPSVAAQLRVFRWGGLGFGAGWRQPLLTPGAVQRELNGPVFHLRAKLFLSDLYKVVRDKQPLFSQQGLRH